MNNEAYRSASGYTHQYFEYSVKMKNNGALFFRKALILTVALILAFGGFLVFVKTVPSVIVVYFVIIGIGIWYFFRYVHIEYEYVIVSGDFHMDVIYGKRKRKRKYTFQIKGAEVIAPLTEESYARYGKSADRVYRTASGLRSPNAYIALYRDRGVKCAAIFDVTKKAMDILKYYNRNTEISERITL